MSDSVREQFCSKFQTLVAENMGMDISLGMSNLLIEFMADYEVTARETGLVVYESLIPSWMNEYLVAKVIKGCKDNSMKDYASHLKRFFDFVHMPVNEITESDVQKYLGYSLKTLNNSKTYVDHKRTVINDFFKWSVNKGYIHSNPCIDIPPIHGQRTKRVPYNNEEMAILRNKIKNLRDKAIVEMLSVSGCRIAELCRVKISDIDFNRMSFTILGKGDKYRTGYFTAECKLLIDDYLKTRTDDCQYLFVRKRKTGSGEYVGLTTHAVQTMLRRLSPQIGVNKVQAHRFRRTFATELKNSGVSIHTIQQLLGHTSIATTEKYIYDNDESVQLEHRRFVK